LQELYEPYDDSLMYETTGKVKARDDEPAIESSASNNYTGLKTIQHKKTKTIDFGQLNIPLETECSLQDSTGK